jgi:nicotinamidase-related amidase
MHSCLLLVDLQNDYFPGGKMELAGIEAAAANARKLLHTFRQAVRPVIHVQHLAAQPGATFFLPESDGAGIHRMFTPQASESRVVKHFPNSFRATPLLELLHKGGIDNLVICGAMSHMCIDATTRAAFDLGFSCRVAEDACATRDLVFKGQTVKASDVHAAFMAALSFPYARVMSTQDVIAGRG